MSKKYKYRVFLSPKSEIFEVAFGLVNNTSTIYNNLKVLPALAEQLEDDDFDTLVKEVMQLLDIGAIESARVKKSRYNASLRAVAATSEFKNMDVSQYIPTSSGNSNA